jgi:hypothetical protein
LFKEYEFVKNAFAGLDSAEGVFAIIDAIVTNG